MESGLLPPQSTIGGLGQCRSSVSEVRGGAPAKDENDFGAFLREKPPLVNRVIKC